MIDESQLGKHYQEITIKLKEIIPVDWDEIIMYGEELGDASTVCFYYKPKGEKQYKYSGRIPDDYSVNDALYAEKMFELMRINKRLWQEFVDAGEPRWETVTFKIDRNYHFKIHFGYDVDEEISDFERKLRWAYDELGLVPEGEFGKKMVEEYIQNKANG